LCSFHCEQFVFLQISGKRGAQELAKALKARGVDRLDFVLDEGFPLTKNLIPGTDKPIAMYVSRKQFACSQVTFTISSDLFTLHYVTLHYVTLRYIMLHYITLQYVTLHYVTLHYITLRYITLNYITLRYIILHYITLRYIMLHYITLHLVTLSYITLCYITLCYITLHYTTLQQNKLPNKKTKNVLFLQCIQRIRPKCCTCRFLYEQQ